jgi:hypothetical protein
MIVIADKLGIHRETVNVSFRMATILQYGLNFAFFHDPTDRLYGFGSIFGDFALGKVFFVQLFVLFDLFFKFFKKIRKHHSF